MEFKSVNEILDFAIEKEAEAAAFYKGLAMKMQQNYMQTVFEQFSEEWLENLNLEELQELNQLSEDELNTVMDALKDATESVESEQPDVVETPEIDFKEELELIDQVEDVPY